jgi:hypothetical protein
MRAIGSMRALARFGLGLFGLAVALALVSTAAAEAVYVGGQTYEIDAVSPPIFGAPPSLLDLASPIFILGYPVAPGTTGPITLPSGYQPQHNGFPPSPIPYHDHVLVAVPGDAGYVAPLRVVEMRYAWAYAYSPDFAPVRSYEDLVASESAGIFEPINPSGTNPYERWTTTVLVRPVVHKDR